MWPLDFTPFLSPPVEGEHRSSFQNPSWFGSLKWNQMFSSCSYDIFSDYLYNSSISPGNASGPADAGFLLPAEHCGWRLYLTSAVALSSALWWQCNQSLHSGTLFLGTHLNALLSGACKIIKIRTRDDLASATFGYFIGLKYSLTVDFLIKPTISYCERLVPQLSGHSTLLLEQREAVCSLKDSLVIFLLHCWQGSLYFVHCTVCAAILSLVTICTHHWHTAFEIFHTFLSAARACEIFLSIDSCSYYT